MTTAKLSLRVIAVPLGLDDARPVLGQFFLFPALLYASGLKPGLATTNANVS